jgi:hypothetical protein
MEVLRERMRASLDWRRVLAIANWHGVVPLVETAITDLGRCGVPDEEVSAIQSAFLRLAADSLVYARELARIMACLADWNVPAIAFKGPALAISFYGNIALRKCTDLDVLTALPDIANALEALRSLGYELHPRNGFGSPAGLRTEKDYLLECAASFKVELHWAAAERSFCFRMPFHEIWRRREHVVLFDRRVPAPHPEDLLLLLSVHGTRHCWRALKWICDLAFVIKQRPDIEWPRVCARAAEARCLRMLLIGLTLSRDLTRVPLPEVVDRHLEQDRAAAIISADLRERLLANRGIPFDLERTLYYVRSHERWVDRARMVGCYVADNSRPGARDREWIRLPGFLSFLYWPIRIARVLHCHWGDTIKPLLSTVAHRNAH